MVISILIAARNEEKNIINCLSSIKNLDFPKDKYEVLIGNDASTDKTKELIIKYIENKPNFHLHDITKNKGLAKGKANVLAHLASEAKGNYFLITDADIIVNPLWAKGMLESITKKTGVVTGFTMIRGKSAFAKLQNIDWISGLSIIKVISDLGIPVTSMGNNMLITKEAYFSVGGYENLPFSVTEDYALFKAVTKNKWGFKNLINKEVIAYSQPIDTFKELLYQRKRWMNGAMQLPIFILFFLGLNALFIPLIIILFTINPIWAAIIWAAKIIFQAILIFPTLKSFNKLSLLLLIPFYEVYVNILSLTAIFFYFLPFKLKWKERIY